MTHHVQRVRVKFKDGTWDTFTVVKFELDDGMYRFYFENGSMKEFPQGIVHELDLLNNLQEVNE